MYNSYKTYPAVLFLGEYFKICEVFIYMISRKIMAPFSLGSVLVSSVDGQHIIVGNNFDLEVLLLAQFNKFYASYLFVQSNMLIFAKANKSSQAMFVYKIFTCVGSLASWSLYTLSL